MDPNNLYDGKAYKHYARGNYYVNAKLRAFIDPEQKGWLKKDLASTRKKCVIFSHQSLDQAVGNREEIRKLLEDENTRAGAQKVVAAFSGHNHSNYVVNINGISYIQINSASYVWIGAPTLTENRYPKEINSKYSLLKYSITYDKPLYGIVTLDKNGLSMKGTQAGFMPPTPQDLKLPDKQGTFPLVSEIKDVKISFNKEKKEQKM